MTAPIWTVSQLAQECRQLLEQGLGRLWVEGELTGLMRPQSGHWYFSLKDAKASIKCVMFKASQKHSPTPANGQLVRARLRASVYEARGELQFTVEQLEPAGLGPLQLAFLALKQRLELEGLFDVARKKALPAAPRRLAVVTSPQGAALQDVLKVLKDRSPWIQIRVYPCLVQGEQAPASIRQALSQAEQQAFGELILICRGGGSFEDLFCFNDEALVRAIAACRLPTLTGIGHEIDFSLADFAADRRAATPSAAAEMLSPDKHHYQQRLKQLKHRLYHGFKRQQHQQLQALKLLRQRVRAQHPQTRLQQLWLQLDELQLRLERGFMRLHDRQRHRLQLAQRSLRLQHPLVRLAHHRQRLQQLEQQQLNAMRHRLGQWQQQRQSLEQRLHQQRPTLERQRVQHQQYRQRLDQAIRLQLERGRQRLAYQAGLLQQLSPLHTLTRGYSISLYQNQPVNSIEPLESGQLLITRLTDGRVISRIERLETLDDPNQL